LPFASASVWRAPCSSSKAMIRPCPSFAEFEPESLRPVF
jgi:hypothetical protein